MRVHCRTNLDLSGEHWPEDMPAVPHVGHRIQSTTYWPGGFQLELEVVAVTWQNQAPPWAVNTDSVHLHWSWAPVIELHIPRCPVRSLREFYEWYAPLVGRSVSAFI